MKYIITGGGTGGHISPALAIIDIIKDRDGYAQFLYIGSKDSMESRIVSEKNIRFMTVETGYMNRKIVSIENIRTVFKNFIGLIQAIKIIRKEKPDVVIGTGGFVSGPVVLAGKLCGHKTVIHEQNAYPGITNKLLGKIADLIMISFNEAENFFNKSKNIVLTGNPVRKDLYMYEREVSRKEMGMKEDSFFIYSFGGSGGQLSLNNAIIQLIELIKFQKNIHLLHITGQRLFEKFKQDLGENKFMELPPNIIVKDYMDEAPKVLNSCDLVIGSGGAITIAEITSLGLASVLIPKAYTAENHQEKNARNIEKNGAAFVFTEKEITGEKLYDIIKFLMDDKIAFQEMKKKSLLLANDNIENKIFESLKNLLDERNNDI